MMDTRTLIKYMLVACTAGLAYLWLISKLAPSPSKSRRQVEYGLNSLHQPTEPSSKNRTDTKDWAKTAVIFVHGLGADPTKTWCDGKTCWITDFLPDDIKQEGLDPFVNLFTFDYDSFWVRDANSATLTHTARDLGQELKHRELAQSNLVLIAHSYGGLVVKKALVLNPDLESRVKAVIFLGTPHRGTKYARFGILASWLLGPLDADVNIMRPLSYDNVDLDDLNKDFDATLRMTERRYFFETHKMRRYLLGFIPYLREFVVEKQSATAGANAVQVRSLHTDHRGLNRFGSRNANYRKLVRELLDILNQAVKSPAFQDRVATPFQDSGLQRRWLVPFTRNPSFVGRAKFLDEMKKRLKLDQDSVLTHTRMSLFGLGGIGKTQIAIAFVHLIQDTCPKVSVFWVYAGTSARFRQAFASIAGHCNIPGHDDPKTDVPFLVKEWLENTDSGRWLLVIDNADDMDVFFPTREDGGINGSPTDGSCGRYLPNCTHGSILITTRNKKVGVRLSREQQVVEVSNMDDSESQQLLQGKLDMQVSKNTTSVLSSRLEHLPLALVQAAAFIRENSLTPDKYIELLDGSDQNLVDLLSQPFETVGRDSDTPHPVAETWMLSFNQIQAQNPLASDLLSFMCLLDRQGIPEEFVYDFYECSKEKIRMREWRDSLGRNNTANHSIDVGDETTNSDDSEGNDFAIAASNIIEPNSQHSVQDVEYIKCIGVLKAFSFISEQDGGLNMHRLVQLVTKQWLDSQSSSTRFSKEALVVVRRRFPYGKFETREVCRRYLPHAYAAMNNRATGSRMARSHLLYNVASFCVYQYWWADAERFVTEAIDINKNVLGEHAHNTRASMHLLGWIFIQTGRWNKAEKIIDQILESAQQESDGDSCDTIALKHELAELYQHQGRLEEAEQLLLVVVDVKTAMDGVEHPDTLFCARALAWVYQRQHRFKEAEQLFLQVLEAQTRTLGVEHFDTLISKHSLSQSYQRQGRLEEAEQLLLRALEASKRTFGAGHTNTITVKHSLATVWKGMGRTEDAIHLMKECALFDKQVLGADHPHTQISLQCLEEWEPSEEVIDRGDASSAEDEGGDLDKEEDR